MTKKKKKGKKLTPKLLLEHFDTPIRFEQLMTGDSVSFDSAGDLHFFHCLFNIEEKPPKCGGWSKADKYPYRVYYRAVDHDLTVQMDIERIVCPSGCEEDCKFEYWSEPWDGNFILLGV